MVTVKRLWVTLIVALVLVPVQSRLGSLSAEPLPPHGRPTLEKILRESEFQPRTTNQGLITMLLERVGRTVKAKVDEWIEWLSARVEAPRAPAGMAAIFERIFAAVSFVLLIILRFLGSAVGLVALAAIAFLLFLLLRWAFSARPVRERGTDQRNMSIVRPPNLSALLASGAYGQLLDALRLVLRQGFEKDFGLQNSLTDRELSRHLPPASRGLSLFVEVTRLFEEVAFAQGRIQPEQVTGLVKTYGQLFSSSPS